MHVETVHCSNQCQQDPHVNGKMLIYIYIERERYIYIQTNHYEDEADPEKASDKIM